MSESSAKSSTEMNFQSAQALMLSECSYPSMLDFKYPAKTPHQYTSPRNIYYEQLSYAAIIRVMSCCDNAMVGVAWHGVSTEADPRVGSFICCLDTPHHRHGAVVHARHGACGHTPLIR